MFDKHLNRQHRLSYATRGPEWAFIVPDGDLVALEEVMRLCSHFWNGAGTLLVPAGADGATPPWIERLVAIRPLDQAFAHRGVPAEQHTALQEGLGAPVGRLHDSVIEHETHPLWLAPMLEPAEAGPSLAVPAADATAARWAAALWGDLPAADRHHWAERFDVYDAPPEAFIGALLEGQIATPPRSPLALSSAGMNLRHHAMPFDFPQLFIMNEPSFDALVMFWNTRSRALPTASVIGLPRAALDDTTHLQALVDWARSPADWQRSPDLVVVANDDDDEAIDEALHALGLDPDDEPVFGHAFGPNVVARERPTYTYHGPMVGGDFVRGATATSLIAFGTGRTSLSLPLPDAGPQRGGGRIRLCLSNLPFPLPVTARAARRFHEHAVAEDDGVMVVTAAMGGRPWNSDFTLPTAREALTDWAADRGFTVRPSGAGRSATALLRRLRCLNRLDVFAYPDARAVLQALTFPARNKLAQRLAHEARRADPETKVTTEALVERLADIEVPQDVLFRDANALAGTTGLGRREILRALTPLVEAGLVVRGYAVTCPECRYQQFADLDGIGEHVTCRFCAHRFVLPITDDGGQDEPARSYRLDGVMARAMHQDLIPVLLALRATRAQEPDLFFAWPGLEFLDPDDKLVGEVDLLTSNGFTVRAFEIKSNAATLPAAQLDTLVALCEGLDARPGIAALHATFEPELASRADVLNLA